MPTIPRWIDDELQGLSRRGLRRKRRAVHSCEGARLRIGGRDFVNFASNDYLDLASDPRLASAAARAAKRYGCGAGSSPLVSGYSTPLRRLEKSLAAFEGEEAALVFSSGFAANIGVITSLVEKGDAIFSDRLNHASLIDGCRLSGAAIHVYDHCDISHLEELLRKHAATARRRLIVTESVFSMDGDVVPLSCLGDLAQQYDAMLLVDEAHATGIIDHRRDAEGAENPAIRVGTLSKALGCQGGFVVGSGPLIDWFINRARPYIFSTAIAPPTCAAARRALQIVQEEPGRRLQVLRRATELRAALQEAGYCTEKSDSQIVPLIIGDPRETVRLSAQLRERGFLIPAIRPPSVPSGTSRLRISVTAGHSSEDIARLVDALVSCRLDSPLHVRA